MDFSKINILVVDTDPEIQNLIRETLFKKGFLEVHVVIADSRSEAENRLSESKIDLIIADLKFPEVEGFRLFKSLKTKKILKDIPFILVEDNKSNIFKDIFLSEGVKRVITKKEIPGAIKDMIEKIIQPVKL